MAHPDDEASTTGGILAKYAGDGVRTVLVTCTNGECGDGPGGTKPGDPATGSRHAAKRSSRGGTTGPAGRTKSSVPNISVKSSSENRRKNTFSAWLACAPSAPSLACASSRQSITAAMSSSGEPNRLSSTSGSSTPESAIRCLVSAKRDRRTVG